MKILFILRRVVICGLNQKPDFARVGFRLGIAMILSVAVIGVNAQKSQRDSPNSALPAQSHPERDAATDPQAGEEVTVQVEDEVALAAMASIYSTTSVFIVITLGLFGLRVSSKFRSRQAVVPASESARAEDSHDADWVQEKEIVEAFEADSEPHSETRKSKTVIIEEPGFAFEPATKSDQ